MKTKLLALLLVLSIVSLMGCRTTKEDLSEDNAITQGNDDSNTSSQLVTYGVAGFITDISTQDNGFGTILVEGELNKNGAYYDKASVRITKDTIIYLSDQVDFKDLELNQYVQVFFEGPVAESYPVQGSARQVNIVNEPIFIDDSTESE